MQLAGKMYRALAWFVVISGCGPSIHVVPASGTITLDGNPLANVNIATEPIGTGRDSTLTPGSKSTTDENGHFTLRLQSDDRSGAIVGKHTAFITFGNDPTHQTPDTNNPKLRQEYWDGSLSFSVPEEGTDELKFDLESVK